MRSETKTAILGFSIIIIMMHACTNNTPHLPYCFKEWPLLQDRSCFALCFWEELKSYRTSNQKDNSTDNQCKIRKSLDINCTVYDRDTRGDISMDEITLQVLVPGYWKKSC